MTSSPPAPTGVTAYPSFLPDDLPNPPLAAPPSHFLSDLPDSASPSEQHAWLESHGFVPDNSMHSYTHTRNPCPVCNSDGHVLFARWEEDSAAPSYFCQKLQKRTEWSPAADALPVPEMAVGLPVEEDADPPPAGTASWTEVTSHRGIERATEVDRNQGQETPPIPSQQRPRQAVEGQHLLPQRGGGLQVRRVRGRYRR